MDPRTTALELVGYQNDAFAQDGFLRGVIVDPRSVDSLWPTASRSSGLSPRRR